MQHAALIPTFTHFCRHLLLTFNLPSLPFQSHNDRMTVAAADHAGLTVRPQNKWLHMATMVIAILSMLAIALIALIGFLQRVCVSCLPPFVFASMIFFNMIRSCWQKTCWPGGQVTGGDSGELLATG